MVGGGAKLGGGVCLGAVLKVGALWCQGWWLPGQQAEKRGGSLCPDREKETEVREGR